MGGNFSAKDNTYECWLIAEELEGTYALCPPEDIEVVKEDPPEDAEPKETFGVGDRIRGKESGKMGTVVSGDADGDPKVKLDEEDEPQQRFGSEFEVVEKAPQPFTVGDRVRGKESGKMGTVVAVDEDGDPKVQLDGEDEAKQRWAKEFEIVQKRSNSSSSSRSGGKKKKKKKKSSSSSSSSSGKRKKKKRKRSSSSGSRQRLKSGGFGRSQMEQ